MRQLSIVVMTLGVALCTAPFFNSVKAQQNRGQPNLLLEVQSMRQEIAQLRDMIERQQFEMRKLKREQLELKQSLTTQLQSQQNFAPAPNQDNYNISNNADAVSDMPQVVTNTTGTVAPYSNVGLPNSATNSASLDSNPNQEISTDSGNAGRFSSPNGTVIEEREINAAPKEFTRTSNEGVPVVERSFNQQMRDVPITGNGTRNTINQASQTYPQEIQDNQALNASGVSNTDRQNQSGSRPAGSVISIPPTGPGQWQTKSATAETAVGSTINANKVPVNPYNQRSSEVAAAQSVIAATDNSSNSAPTLSEDDYYGQGFELLKQSKYEEAATIFERQIKAYPQGDLADDAHYWIAEAMHVSRKLDVSKRHLRIIINDYPQSPRLPDAMLKTAYIEQSEGNKIEAQILFQEIVNLHPKSDAAIAAKNQLSAKK